MRRLNSVDLNLLRTFQPLRGRNGSSFAVILNRPLDSCDVVEDTIDEITGECSLTLIRQEGAVCGFIVTLIRTKATIEPCYCLVDNGGESFDVHSENYSGLNVYVSETDSVLISVNDITPIEVALEEDRR